MQDRDWKNRTARAGSASGRQEEPYYTDQPLPPRDSFIVRSRPATYEADRPSGSGYDRPSGSGYTRQTDGFGRRSTDRPSGRDLPRTGIFSNADPDLLAELFGTADRTRQTPPPPRTELTPRLRELTEMFRSVDPLTNKKAAAFYEQARFMEDYEDDLVYRGTFFRYYPTYRDMNAAQLRGYFGWRTRLRAGQTTSAPLSFHYLYLYEILNGIGWKEPEEGLQILNRLFDESFRSDPEMHARIRAWRRDFIIYYDLHGEEAERCFEPERAMDQMVAILYEPEGRTGEEILAAMAAAGGYPIERSAFFRKRSREGAYAAGRLYEKLTDHYRRLCYRTPAERFFGLRQKTETHLFHGAVFYNRIPHREYCYQVAPARVYRCEDGVWSCESYPLPESEQQRKLLSDLLRELDRQGRIAFGGSRLKPRPLDPALVRLVEEAVQDCADALAAGDVPRHRQAGRPVEKAGLGTNDMPAGIGVAGTGSQESSTKGFRIDLGKLDGIRADADHTRDRLLQDLPGAASAAEVPQASDASDAPAIQDARKEEKPALTPQSPAPIPEAKASDITVPETQAPDVQGSSFADEPALTEMERFFLSCLLHGDPWKDALREARLFPSMLADAINEKLLPLLGDTPIVTDEEEPTLLEDYRGDVEAILGPSAAQ